MTEAEYLASRDPRRVPRCVCFRPVCGVTAWASYAVARLFTFMGDEACRDGAAWLAAAVAYEATGVVHDPAAMMCPRFVVRPCLGGAR